MKKVLAFGASNSKNSINKQFASYAANRLEGVEMNLLDLNDFTLPLYSVDLESESGVPQAAIDFDKYIGEADAVIISLAEYNSLYTSAFKNMWDWVSRVKDRDSLWGDKPMFLLSTGPGKAEISRVHKLSLELFPSYGADIVANFHLPSFNHFFKDRQIIEPEYLERFDKELEKFQEVLSS